MKTKERRAQEFLAEFHALLQKHKVEISLEEESSGYYHCTKQMVATIKAEFDPIECTCIAEHTTIELGSWLDHETCEYEFVTVPKVTSF